MTRMRNLDYFRSMAPDSDPEAMLAWVDGFPFYAQFGWGLGVWMGLLGSVLLLMRNRWAVPVLGLSLLGAVLGPWLPDLLGRPAAAADGRRWHGDNAVGDHPDRCGDFISTRTARSRRACCAR